MPVRQDKSESSALTSKLAGYVCLVLAMGSALTRNWYGAAGFAVAAIAMLIVGSGRVYRPAVTRGPDGIICRYNPWRESSLYVLLVYAPAGMLYAFGQPTRWLQLLAIAGFFVVAVGLAFYVREWRRCRLQITPSSLTLSVPALRYAWTEIPRERIVSITGGTGARRNGDTGPVTQIAYIAADSSSGMPSSVLIGPTNTKNAMWLTVEQADLLAALHAWQYGDPSDPALLDRVDALLRGQAPNADGVGSTSVLGTGHTPAASIDAGFPAGAGAAPEVVDYPQISPPPPAAQPSPWRWLRFGAIGLAGLIGVAAVPAYHSIHRSSDDRSTVSSAPETVTADCPVEGARTVALPKKAADEPTVYLPLNAGWTEQPATPGASEDTPNLRGLYSNESIRENGFTPVIHVDLVRTDSGDSLSKVADDLFTKARTMMQVANETSDTVCGSTVYRADTSGYNPDGKGDRSGTTLLTIVEGKANTRWVAIASIKTRNPDQSDYLSQREALIRGFRAGFR